MQFNTQERLKPEIAETAIEKTDVVIPQESTLDLNGSSQNVRWS
jgi:hypothetical protein